jgi:predicted nucleic acid-binding protein
VSAVIDASVLVAATTDAGRAGVWAEEVIGEGGLIAPQLVLVEAANTLRGLERAQKLTRLEATAAHDDLNSLDLSLVGYDPFADRIWELRHNITTYDAWYVAIAEALDLPLATLDAKLSDAAQTQCDFWLPS